MKKFSRIVALLALIHATGLQGQTTGEVASATADAAKETTWQNWTFAGVALAVAVGAIYVVALNDGRSAPIDSDD